MYVNIMDTPSLPFSFGRFVQTNEGVGRAPKELKEVWGSKEEQRGSIEE
jgi:hypothetical protein